MLFYYSFYFATLPIEQTIVCNAHHPQCPSFVDSLRVTPPSTVPLSAMPTANSPIVRDDIVSSTNCLQPHYWKRKFLLHKCCPYPSSAALLSAAPLSAHQLSEMPIVGDAHCLGTHHPQCRFWRGPSSVCPIVRDPIVHGFVLDNTHHQWSHRQQHHPCQRSLCVDP